jgi:hypothetical protein
MQRWPDLPPPAPWRVDKIVEQSDMVFDYRAVLEIIAFLASSDFYLLFLTYLVYRGIRLWLQNAS